jgi:phenylacetic acid degradation protein
LVVGNPARIIRELSDEMIDWKRKGTELYQKLARESHLEIKECIPYQEKPEDYPSPTGEYSSWKKHTDTEI